MPEDDALVQLLRRAYAEVEAFGNIFVDTEIGLNNLGIDPEIVKEEAIKHGRQ